LIRIAEGSLKSLKTDYFDLYLIGAINPETSVKDLMDGLIYLKEHGLTKDIGVSNYRLPELTAAVEYTGENIVYSEMHYNLIIREPEIDGSLNFCKKHNIILSAYRPLQLGQLSKPGIVMLDDLARKYGKTQSQIVLRWLVQKDGVVAVVKALGENHLKENLDIFNWSLSGEDMERLNKDFPIKIRISDCSSPRKFKF